MKRLGLVGFNTESGLGVMNRQLIRHLPIDTWLVRGHRYLPCLPLPDRCHVIQPACGIDMLNTLRDMDVMLFCENPLWLDMPQRAREWGKRVVCVPMQEWFPPFDHAEWAWPKYVDLFICPTRHCYNQLKDRYPCVYIPWPVDLDFWQYHTREVCRRFVFINGHGGWRGRKGGKVVGRALELWPEMPITVFSQVEDEWIPDDARIYPQSDNLTYPNLKLRGTCDDSDLPGMYNAGDVLLCPHSCDGIGLEIGEALASGMPVVATEGRPWNEYPLLATILAVKERRRIKREVDWYLPCPKRLVDLCKSLLGWDISQASIDAYFWARDHAWDKWAGKLTELVLG